MPARVKPVSRRAADGFLQVGVRDVRRRPVAHLVRPRPPAGLAGRAMVRVGGGRVEGLRHCCASTGRCCASRRWPSTSTGRRSSGVQQGGAAVPDRGARRRGDGARRGGEVRGRRRQGAGGRGRGAARGRGEERHHPRLVELLAESAGCAPADIVDFEVVLYDTQKAALGGAQRHELIFSARLDNLNMSVLRAVRRGSSARSRTRRASGPTRRSRLIALFDHEEIGSRTAQGADSNLLPAILRRLSAVEIRGNKPKDGTAFEEMLEKSFLVSADMAHSVHPNYGGKHEALHRPEMNRGVVIKVNANARYATNAPGIDAAAGGGAPRTPGWRRTPASPPTTRPARARASRCSCSSCATTRAAAAPSGPC